MAEPAPKIQFGDEIHPIKTTPSRVFPINEDPSLARKAAGYDYEEKAIQIANDDLNRTNKQVRDALARCDARDTDTGRLTQDGLSYGWRTKVSVLYMATSEQALFTYTLLHSQVSRLGMIWSAHCPSLFGP